MRYVLESPTNLIPHEAPPREDDRMEDPRPDDRNLLSEAPMLTADGLAGLLDCSPRSVRRLADRGKIPPPVRIGGLVRWPRTVIQLWLAEGCPAATTRRRRR